MPIYHETIAVESAARPTFHDISVPVREVFARSGLRNGTILVYTGHTTCSINIQEYSDGQAYTGNELIMQDLANVMSRLIPTCLSESQYLHPCAEHVRIAGKERQEEPVWCLNTDAHLRSVVLGRSVTIPVIDGEIQLGEFGRIFFGDWDQTRARSRKIIVQVTGE
ncbi:MAG: secondary thiamine-phosphate synthase enzyme YjbQ [Planctomycetes bacterium]|nr:secondary thiamine-phosphate synthase enzyme YjbQ [Planctomycetota bacterium]